MTDEDRTRPATVADLETWSGNLAWQIKYLDERVDRLEAKVETGFAKQQQISEPTLKGLESVQGRLKDMASVPLWRSGCRTTKNGSPFLSRTRGTWNN